MAALSPGKTTPDFTLLSIHGKSFSLGAELTRGPVVLAFFKVSCPVCQYTFPFLERIYQAYRRKSVAILGVSQNLKKDTNAFIREYGITFPVLLDDTDTYAVSNAYGLTTVPTTFWIAPDGKIEISSVGWVRQEITEINQKAAEETGLPLKPLFADVEDVPAFRPG